MRRTHHHQRTAAGVALATALLLGAAACGPDAAGPTASPTPATSGPSGPSVDDTPTDDPREADVSTRLADAVRAQDPTLADRVTADGTTVTPLATPWLTGWQVLDVLAAGGSHGARAHVALSDDGEAVVLAGAPEAFADVLARADVQVADEATAVAVVDTYLDATRSFRQWSQRVVSFDDIRLRPRLDADAQAAVDAAHATLEGQLAPTTATPTDDGFDVVAWVADGGTVVRHTVHLGADGTLADDAEDVVTDLPVPISR